MKQLFRISLIAVSMLGAISMAGCEHSVEIKDGKVPSEFVPFVEQYLGHYAGQFDRKMNVIDLSMDGERLVLNTEADLLGSGCRSMVGPLKKLEYKKKDNKVEEVTSAQFDFDPGLCASSAKGRTLALEGSKNKADVTGIDVSLLKEIQEHTHYEPGKTTCYVGSNGHLDCHASPGRWVTEYEYIYYSGKFVRN